MQNGSRLIGVCCFPCGLLLEYVLALLLWKGGKSGHDGFNLITTNANGSINRTCTLVPYATIYLLASREVHGLEGSDIVHPLWTHKGEREMWIAPQLWCKREEEVAECARIGGGRVG